MENDRRSDNLFNEPTTATESPEASIAKLTYEGLEQFKNNQVQASLNTWKRVIKIDQFNQEALFYIREGFAEAEKRSMIAKLLGISSTAIEEEKPLKALVYALMVRGLDRKSVLANRNILMAMDMLKGEVKDKLYYQNKAEDYNPNLERDRGEKDGEMVDSQAGIPLLNPDDIDIEKVRELEEKGMLESAHAACQILAEKKPQDLLIKDKLNKLKERLEEKYLNRLGGLLKYPVKKDIDKFEIFKHNLPIEEKYIYSMINGRKKVKSIIKASSLAEIDILKILDRFARKGFIEMRDEKQPKEQGDDGK